MPSLARLGVPRRNFALTGAFFGLLKRLCLAAGPAGRLDNKPAEARPANRRRERREATSTPAALDRTILQDFTEAVDFAKAEGLVTAVVQDCATGRVLMVAHMNREALCETVATGRACYYSRSRKKLWRKGEESGNYQEVREIRLDCDGDTLLLSVDQRGDGAACHQGFQSCFFRALRDQAWTAVDSPKVDPAKYGPSYGRHGSSG